MGEIIRIHEGVEFTQDDQHPSDNSDEVPGKSSHLREVPAGIPQGENIVPFPQNYFSNESTTVNGSSALKVTEALPVPLHGVDRIAIRTRLHGLASTAEGNFDVSGRIHTLFGPDAYVDQEGYTRVIWETQESSNGEHITFHTNYPTPRSETVQVYGKVQEVGYEGDQLVHLYTEPTRVGTPHHGFRFGEHKVTAIKELGSTGRNLELNVHTRVDSLLPHK